MVDVALVIVRDLSAQMGFQIGVGLGPVSYPHLINANPCRIARRHGIVPEDPAHVMEQLGCRQHDGRITELVKAVKEELSIRIALGSGAGEPIPGLLPILFHIPAQEVDVYKRQTSFWCSPALPAVPI